MSTVLLASYPEVFAGGAIIAGLPYGCAQDLKSAFNCQSPGVDLEPTEWAKRIREALPAAYRNPKQWPRVSIWHGDQDALVHPMNANELLDQWTALHGVDRIAEIEDTVKGYPHRVYQDPAGNALVDTYELTGMDHGLPIDPGSGEDQCGNEAPFILPVGLCSSYYIARFWGIAPAPSSALSTAAGETPAHEQL
jgi:poly(3-hydroxybutyrate) depolymerase